MTVATRLRAAMPILGALAFLAAIAMPSVAAAAENSSVDSPAGSIPGLPPGWEHAPVTHPGPDYVFEGFGRLSGGFHSEILHWPYLDDVPLFVSEPPAGAIGPTVVFKIRVLHYLNAGQCTHAAPTSPPKIPVETKPTPFAYAEVVEVVRGEYALPTVMVCDINTSETFKIGETGLIWGKLTKNSTDYRLDPVETGRERVARWFSERFPWTESFLSDWKRQRP